MATIKDVAEKAGVTVTTVSRVLNNRGYISQATREKVYRVMKEMQYQPNEIARSLIGKRSMMLGMIIPTVAHPFFAELANYIENHASSLGYKILICNSRMDQLKEKEYIDMLKSNRVEGIIMGSHTLDVHEYTQLQQPIVTFDRFITGIPYVSSDNYHGGVLAAELLIRKGCKKIALICGRRNPDLLGDLRSEGFLKTLNSKSLEPIVIELGSDVFENVHYERVVQNLLDEHPDVDGLFATSDMIAINAIKVCSSIGMKIPEQIKLIGYDDIQFASLMTPGLTTIKQPLEEMGILAVDLIDKLVAGEKVTMENKLPVTMVERSST
ncbi:LacI family DNA-binding transcriptional regulator [Paenibacillus sp. LjRoot153]|uniref:LacI family DNA-binding transcriptional regulator n=1 Tax=Paenibacillus sp. LjRoot153 TaxID=3342270 RepID=UPI003ECE385B